MDQFTLITVPIILAHAFVGWALCGAIMFTGMRLTSLKKTLVIHAIRAPVIFGLVSLVYFCFFNYTVPLTTAIIFTSFVVVMDFFLVALVINKSLDMFRSWLGTWLPFALIFSSTYLTGFLIEA